MGFTGAGLVTAVKGTKKGTAAGAKAAKRAPKKTKSAIEKLTGQPDVLGRLVAIRREYLIDAPRRWF